MSILERAREVRSQRADMFDQRAAQKRAALEQGAVELHNMLAPLAGQRVKYGDESGVLSVRADSHGAYLEFVPDEHYQASAKFDGRVVMEQRTRPGTMATARMTLVKMVDGYTAAGLGLPAKTVPHIRVVEELVAAVVGRMLE